MTGPMMTMKMMTTMLKGTREKTRHKSQED